MAIIGVLVAGISVGLLGRLVTVVKKDDTPLWLTVLCGIVGALIGWILFEAFAGSSSAGLDWDCWIVMVVGAAIPVVIAVTLMGRNKFNFPR